MDSNDLNTLINLHKKPELICCGLCSRKSFESRTDLYQHFHNHHNINQEFRGLNVFPSNMNLTDDDDSGTMGDKQTEESLTSREQSRNHLNEQMNGKNETLHTVDTVTYHTSNVFDKTKSSLASSSAISSLEKNVPSIVEHLPTNNVILGCKYVRATTKPTSNAVILNKPKVTLHYYPTSTDLNAGKTRPPLQHSTHQPCNSYQNVLEAAAYNSAYFSKLVNSRSQHIHRSQPWRPDAAGNVKMGFDDKENFMTGLRNGGITEQTHRDIPLYSPQIVNACIDDITIVNNPTDTI